MTRVSAGHRVGLIAKEEPPPTAAIGSVLAELIDLIPQLRAERGTWFKVAEFVSPSAAYQNGRKFRDKYPQQLETSHARVGTGSVLYARWTGSRTNGVA